MSLSLPKGLFSKLAEPLEKGDEHGTGIPTLKPWFKPFPHQEAAVKKLYENKGKLILAHQTGTGKTATAIYAFEKMRHEGKAKKALVVVPSSLRNNFGESGVAKFTTSEYQIVGAADEIKNNPRVVRPGFEETDVPYTIVSYGLFRKDPLGFMERSGADTLILDEFHNTRNEATNTFRAALAARNRAVNVLGLTASPINNNPSELATLLTITEGRRDMSPAEFKRRFIQTVGYETGLTNGKKPVKQLKNIPELLRRTYPKIDYVETSQLKENAMPRKETKFVDVPMSDDQYKLYQLALDRLGPLKEYITRRDKDISLKDASHLFGQIMRARQISNSVAMARESVTPERAAEITPKTKLVLDDTVRHLGEKPDNSVVLYSNLVRGGVDTLVAGLKERGIKPAIFVGKGTEIEGDKITSDIRQEGVREFQAGKRRAIVLSGAGAEGLDLKNATAFYALDGHFNPQRILQAEARARRLGGQAHRPPEERVIDVRRYRSVAPESERPGFMGRLVGKETPQTTDEWMYSVAGNKYKQQAQVFSSFRKPYKYIKKYQTATGNTAYVYPEGHESKRPGFVARFGNFFKRDNPTGY